MLLQATLNGGLTKADHGAVPVAAEELAVDAAECVAAGARAFHVHPRDQSGALSLEARVVYRVVTAVRAPHGMPVGVTTCELYRARSAPSAAVDQGVGRSPITPR